MIREATFIHPDTGHAKADKLRENGAKIGRRCENWIKKNAKLYFGHKLYTIIARDYELIRSFKSTTHNFVILKQIYQKKNEVIYRDRGYFGVKSKVMVQQ